MERNERAMRMRAARRAGLTETEIAKLFDTSKTTVHREVRGTQPAPLEVWQSADGNVHIASAYLDSADLLEGVKRALGKRFEVTQR